MTRRPMTRRRRTTRDERLLDAILKRSGPRDPGRLLTPPRRWQPAGTTVRTDTPPRVGD